MEDSFTIGVHSSRPESVCKLGNECNHDNIVYSTGKELRIMNYDQQFDEMTHSKLSNSCHTGVFY